MKLPKTVYVVVESHRDGNEYLEVSADISEVAEDHQRTVGIYRPERKVKAWKEVRVKH